MSAISAYQILIGEKSWPKIELDKSILGRLGLKTEKTLPLLFPKTAVNMAINLLGQTEDIDVSSFIRVNFLIEVEGHFVGKRLSAEALKDVEGVSLDALTKDVRNKLILALDEQIHDGVGNESWLVREGVEAYPSIEAVEWLKQNHPLVKHLKIITFMCPVPGRENTLVNIALVFDQSIITKVSNQGNPEQKFIY